MASSSSIPWGFVNATSESLSSASNAVEAGPVPVETVDSDGHVNEGMLEAVPDVSDDDDDDDDDDEDDVSEISGDVTSEPSKESVARYAL